MKDPEIQLKEHGLKATTPRVAILSVLREAHLPLGAQGVHVKLSKKSGIDLVTVYRTLASFEKAGIVKRVDLRTDTVMYEMSGRHHHHIVCTDCGTVEDFNICEMDKLTQKITQKAKRFSSIREHTLELFGVCNACVKG